MPMITVLRLDKQTKAGSGLFGSEELLGSHLEFAYAPQHGDDVAGHGGLAWPTSGLHPRNPSERVLQRPPTGTPTIKLLGSHPTKMHSDPSDCHSDLQLMVLPRVQMASRAFSHAVWWLWWGLATHFTT